MKKLLFISRFGSFTILLTALFSLFMPVPAAAAAGAAISLLGFQPQGALLATPAATDVQQIAKWAGLYSKKMLGQYLNGLDVFQQNKVDRMVSRQGKLLPKVTISAGIRPLDTSVTRTLKTERSIGGRKIFVYDMMKIFYIEPEELYESFLTDMMQPGTKTIPFAAWIWQKEFEKLASEINDNFYLQVLASDAEAWESGSGYTTGEYVKFTDKNFYRCLSNTSAGESPLTHPAKWTEVNHLVSFDGPAEILRQEIAANNLTPITTGAINNTNALDKLESMYNAMEVPHRNRGGKVKVGPNVYRAYLEHKRDVYGPTATETIGDGRQYIYASGKKWSLEECTWMGNSNRVIFDVNNECLVVGTNLKESPGITKSVETLHGTEFVSKWFFGFQISDLEGIYINDQA